MPEDWEGHPLRKDYDTGHVPVQFKEAPQMRLHDPPAFCRPSCPPMPLPRVLAVGYMTDQGHDRRYRRRPPRPASGSLLRPAPRPRPTGGRQS